MAISYLDNIFDFVDYQYLNPSRNAYGNLSLDTASAVQVVTTAELKSHLRITTSSEDTLLATYISAATQMAEHYCNRHFCHARYSIHFNELPDSFSLYYPDCLVTLTGSAGTTDGLFANIAGTNNYNFVAATNYYIDRRVNPSVFKKTSSFAVPSGTATDSDLDAENTGNIWYFKFRTGIGDAASDIPDAIKQAIKLIAGDMYYFREDRKRQFPMASEILLQPYKCYL